MHVTITVLSETAAHSGTVLRANLASFLSAMREVGVILLASIDQNFAQGGRPSWPPLRLPRTGTPLAGRGRLRASMVQTVTPTSVTVMSTAPFAAVHQFGATIQVPEIRPRRARALRWVTASGQVVFARRVRAHTVVIPARPFAVIQPADEDAIVTIVGDHCMRGV